MGIRNNQNEGESNDTSLKMDGAPYLFVEILSIAVSIQTK